MGKKVGISLIISTEMSAKEEHDVIRLPKRSREYLGLERGKVILGKGSYQVEADIKAAFSADVRRLVSMIKAGKVSEQDAPLMGFVSRSTYQRVSAKPGDDVWLSDGPGAIMVGCDPEFGLINKQGFLSRGDLILPGSKKHKFGEDGPGVEIRPSPSQNHLQVVKNILDILKDPPDNSLPFKWVGGATYTDANRVYWFGGHIHFGRPKDLPLQTAPIFFQNIAWVLDYFLAWPMLSFDTPDPHLRRDGCEEHHYGEAGDIRLKEGNSRFEYRVLSGLWLTHPTLAKTVIGTAKAVVEHVYGLCSKHKFNVAYGAFEGGGEYGSDLTIDAGVPARTPLAKEINKGAVKPLSATKFSKWADKLQELDTYEDYHREVDALIAIVEASPKNVLKHLELDLRENWLNNKPLLENSTPKVKAAVAAVEEMK